jgi:4-hydroxyacetophenone monooxygenase
MMKTTASTTAALIDETQLEQALSRARIPLLLAVLTQLTGDTKWLGERYRPARSKGYETPRSGKLAEEVQAEVRSAALEAIRDFAAGVAPAVPQPESDLLHRLMCTVVGEDVPEDVVPLIADQSGFARHPVPDVRADLAVRTNEWSVAIIGAGVSGLLAADRLDQAGIPYVVFEKNDSVGGTWLENRYPGVRVDIPSDLYSISYAPRNWSENFSQQPDLHDYLVDFAQARKLDRDIRLRTVVESLDWDDEESVWNLTIVGEDGNRRQHRANAVISAVGIHNRPHIPSFRGREHFAGTVVHSAQWPEELSLAGKRVAVLGSGATAMQVVCRIADEAEHLTVLQRTPQWIMPHSEYFGRPEEADRWLMQHVPFYRNWRRAQLYWLYTDRLYPLQVVDQDWDPSGGAVSKANNAFRRALLAYMESELEDRPDLLPLVTPDYPVMGKRLLIDNGWYRTLKRPDVRLHRAGIEEFTEDGIVITGGEEIEVDVVVLCTGFEQQKMLAPMRVAGRDSHRIDVDWQADDARAYLGITTPGYPNLFYMFGPNANPPGGSYFTIAEAQSHYIVDLMARMIQDDLAWLECRQDVFEQYNEKLDEANAQMAYGISGVKNYYRNAAGRVITNSPWRVPEYWSYMHDPDLSDFTVGRADAQ